ncbi:MAG: hypothetical protein KGJ07_00570 [Patescibacteria group bacterium]|nr:hypothetical protein [Patescibacteria group bacterium]
MENLCAFALYLKGGYPIVKVNKKIKTDAKMMETIIQFLMNPNILGVNRNDAIELINGGNQ